MEPVVRKARKSDFENVKHFVREHWEKDLPKTPYKRIQQNTVASFKTHVGKEGTFVLVLDDKIIGYLSAGVCKNESLGFNEGELYMIHIVKEHRGKGYAHLLMKKAEEYFKKKKADYCVVTTNISNEISQSLYKKYGFKPWRIILKKGNV